MRGIQASWALLGEEKAYVKTLGRVLLMKTLDSKGPATVVLLRLLVASVFLLEGVGHTNAGRAGVGVIEAACGLLVLIGLFTRYATLVLLVREVVTLASAQTPPLFAGGPVNIARNIRADWAILVVLIVLLFVGARTWSFDRHLAARLKARIERREVPEWKRGEGEAKNA